MDLLLYEVENKGFVDGFSLDCFLKCCILLLVLNYHLLHYILSNLPSILDEYKWNQPRLNTKKESFPQSQSESLSL